MSEPSTDVLMITYNRPEYTRLALTSLLETCGPTAKVWLWHNGPHAETLEVVKSLAGHARVAEFHHSPENRKLTEPTNWFWTRAKGRYIAKVDDDCIMPAGWVESLRAVHEAVPTLGAIACWLYPAEENLPDLINRKTVRYPSGHKLMRNCWVQGSGYMMKRECVEKHGPLRAGESWTRYCTRLAAAGWVHGWPVPFLYMEHMDDPRSPYTLLKSDADLHRYMPLTPTNFGVTTLEQWKVFLREEAVRLQEASPDPREHVGWRVSLRRWKRKLLGGAGRRSWSPDPPRTLAATPTGKP